MLCPWRGNLNTGNKGVEHMSSYDESDCALVVAQCETSRLEAQRDEIVQTLAELVADIRALQDDIRSGKAKKTEVGASLADLRYWLKAARETEAEIETVRRRESGIVGSWGLDMRAAEHEIGCRLARLKERCGEG